MKLPKVRHPAIARSLDYLVHNWQHPIRVTDLAKVSALSRRGFLKAFLKHIGRHPSDELQRIRMNHAQTLLATTDFPVPKISELCGYRSANSFWVAFRRHHGFSPQQFRKALENRRSAKPISPRGTGLDLNVSQRLNSKPLCRISGVRGHEPVLAS